MYAAARVRSAPAVGAPPRAVAGTCAPVRWREDGRSPVVASSSRVVTPAAVYGVTRQQQQRRHRRRRRGGRGGDASITSVVTAAASSSTSASSRQQQQQQQPSLLPPFLVDVVERLRSDPTLTGAIDTAMRTLQIPMSGSFGIGRRRGGVAPDPDRMLLIEMREDWVEKLPLGYNAMEQDDFWARHQDVVAARLVQLINTSGELVVSVAWDSARGELQRNERQHVQNMRRVFTSLGPAFVKLGQGLAARPDLFSPESVDELARLFCAVPPFPTAEAMRVITRELGAPWWEFFVDLGEFPAAAASLGQVYRGTMRAKPGALGSSGEGFLGVRIRAIAERLPHNLHRKRSKLRNVREGLDATPRRKHGGVHRACFMIVVFTVVT